MSRIAGVVSFQNTYQPSTLLTQMLVALTLKSNWQSHSIPLANVALGWCGDRTFSFSNTHGVLTVMDGFIYNYAQWEPTTSNAELLALLYSRYGFEVALQQINGDFTVALHDPQLDVLWLARDRFGLKPLYYVTTPEIFAFASQPRALLTLPGVSRDVNHQFVALFAASHYRTFDNDPEKSPYADIAQLPAAHILRLSAGQFTKTHYWSLQNLPDFTGSEVELAGRYRELLLDAVSLRVKAAQNPAFTLSGGMDSSSVLASAVHVTRKKQHAFSTIYVDKTYDESDEIKSMLNTTVAEWHTIRVGTPDIFGLVQQMIAVHDEPVATATWLSHFLLCQEAARHGFGGLFGGLGGDELNAGEYEYFFFFFADLQTAGRQDDLQREVEKWILYHDHPVFRKSFEVMQSGLTRLVDLSQPGRCLPDRQRLDRYLAALNPDYFNLVDFASVMDHIFTSYLKNRTYQDIFRETIPCCLRAEDRQTVAFGLDNFLPFFDHRLVEFMFRVPGTLKIRDGVTKILLRMAMRDILPEETRTWVKKTGWNAPAHIWFSSDGRENLLDMIHSRAFQERGIYNVPVVERLVNEHQQIVSTGQLKDNHMMFFWQMVNLETWLAGLS